MRTVLLFFPRNSSPGVSHPRRTQRGPRSVSEAVREDQPRRIADHIYKTSPVTNTPQMKQRHATYRWMQAIAEAKGNGNPSPRPGGASLLLLRLRLHRPPWPLHCRRPRGGGAACPAQRQQRHPLRHGDGGGPDLVFVSAVRQRAATAPGDDPDGERGGRRRRGDTAQEEDAAVPADRGHLRGHAARRSRHEDVWRAAAREEEDERRGLATPNLWKSRCALHPITFGVSLYQIRPLEREREP